MINKIAKTIEMSFEITESEQKEAQEIKKLLEHFLGVLETAREHLDIIYIPFKKATELTPEEVSEDRGQLFLFKGQIKENYDKVKRVGAQILIKFSIFESDPQVLEMINSFRSTIEELEENVVELMDVLDRWQDPSFREDVVKTIESIDEISEEILELVNDRLIAFIDTDILANDWMEQTSEALKLKIEENIPFERQLFEEREKALKEIG